MNNNKSKEIKVGIISILAVILLILGISLGKGVNVSATEKVILSFPNSAGVKTSEPVTINGVEQGTISSVKNYNDKVIIEANVNSSVKIKKDAKAKIMIQELTGGKKIEIYPGYSNELLSSNDTILGDTPQDLSMLVSTLGEVSGDAVTLIRRIDTIAASTSKIINDDKFQDNILTTVDNAAIISEDLKYFSQNELPKLSGTLDRINQLTADLKNAVDKNEPKISNLIDELELTVSNVNNTIDNADKLLLNADKLVLDLNSISDDIKTGDGVASRLIYDKDLANKLNEAIKSLDEFIKQVNDYGVNVNVRLGTRP